ncbi:MAG TPA: PilX N-terminal domain-containing pilus assembly protein [Burkholderiaceae bacterium]|jgi:type IV pilus assembly protein PilX
MKPSQIPIRRRASSASLLRENKQSGAALVVGLIFLVILTLLGLTAMQTGILEERMAGNSRDHNIAFQAAEAALRDGEHDTRCQQNNGATATTKRDIGCISGMTGADTSCTQGLCCNPSTSGLTCIEPSTPVYTKFAGSTSPGISYGTYTAATHITYTIGSTSQDLPKQPQYLIEPFNAQGNNYYRISSQGYGINTSTVVTLQEVYKE